MIAERAPYHVHIYYASDNRVIAERLHEQLSAKKSNSDPGELLFVGSLQDLNVGPHPKSQFEIHLYKDALPGILPLIEATGLTALVHPLTNDDLADHTSQAHWIGEALPLDCSVFDPIGANKGFTRFGKTDF